MPSLPHRPSSLSPRRAGDMPAKSRQKPSASEEEDAPPLPPPSDFWASADGSPQAPPSNDEPLEQLVCSVPVHLLDYCPHNTRAVSKYGVMKLIASLRTNGWQRAVRRTRTSPCPRAHRQPPHTRPPTEGHVDGRPQRGFRPLRRCGRRPSGGRVPRDGGGRPEKVSAGQKPERLRYDGHHAALHPGEPLRRYPACFFCCVSCFAEAVAK
jgi:hypothetical protein